MVLSRIDQALETERKNSAERQLRDRMLRDWMKPRIKRVAGTWVCTGRGTTATGLGPWAAYSAWLMAQSKSVIYATKISAYEMALKVGPC
ncbi:hypothetical protein [Comamonas thiooxydans]|uniref:hypothetical protein n=1 Tax=Comamonas thiooxydans TaxID=363952 RepID=UPI00050DA6C0|nr:hypothetical protein [Comamonas thiooxydans]KGG86714.1 hypothetical protein P609_11235 [Comamonas thiooxydans]